MDDTGARHKSINHYVQVICNHLFSSFFITRRKNRETLRDILGISENEKLALENMMIILDTCRKHNVSFMRYVKDIFSGYVKDIFSGNYSMPRLSTLILEKASSNSTSY
ncbi:hypothetical protein B6U98_04485 [Thermoplasmatales archaeon ex4572_165]|nr:MAG: hypothetical protein B6U98_04485 [Thermoplasmatales archaeon ex4572_165]